MINDTESTVASLVAASRTPLSVIIIGIGNADFNGMQVLDGDKQLLRSRGNVAIRDIVQFCAFRDYSDKLRSVTELAEDVLKEVRFFMRSQYIVYVIN
jgi:hypothetical protein